MLAGLLDAFESSEQWVHLARCKELVAWIWGKTPRSGVGEGFRSLRQHRRIFAPQTAVISAFASRRS